MNNIDNDKLFFVYDYAKNYVHASGYGYESIWQSSLNYADFTEQDLLREAAWVILNSGFKEEVVRKCFNYISLCFCDWESAETIVQNEKNCRETSLVKLNNTKKIDAIIRVASIINECGFVCLKNNIIIDPITELQKLPYIGSVTSFHLAKNLGFPIAKPDRHLVRFAKCFGYDDVQDLCCRISERTGDPIQCVDIVLWRFSVLKGWSAPLTNVQM